MGHHADEALIFGRGDEKTLPHTLADTRHLTLVLVDLDVTAGTVVLELRNPEAEPDSMVGDLIEENEEDVEDTNRWRDKLHLPEKPVPVDTSTTSVEQLHCRLHEKLQIGDRVWTVTDIGADQVTLTPGRDHETDSVANAVEDAGYGRAGTTVAEDLNTIDRGL